MNYRTTMLFVFILIFCLSGFSGLIYQSIWSHYLKLFLGHASYAQVLVIVIFMGGMAIGAAISAHVSRKLTNLILWYGIAEFVIGLFGVSFHYIFTTVQATAFDHIIPNLGAPWLVHATKWLIASAMILPQSILLGATFPLLTAGVIRRFSNSSSHEVSQPLGKGKIIATFYFVNSLGASIGILCNTFWLIPSVGLPGAVLTAGLINIVLGIVVYGLSKRDCYPAVTDQAHVHENNFSPFGTTLLIVATFTGLASFMYEIGWIRMLTMVLGASTHSFEIMLSAFIFGLAVGGFWIRKHIEKIANPIRVLGLIQLTMGALAVLTIPLYNQSYELMGFVMGALNRNDEGYLLYTLFSYSISLLIMLPVTFCAGTTLPLITTILLNQKEGDSAIGKVYAWNTVGSIVGVLLAVQLVMPLLGLKWVIVGGALVDLFLGAYLLYKTGFSIKHNKIHSMVVFICLAVFLCFPIVGLDTMKMSSGVFRFGLQSNEQSEIIFHKDGKTSTVAVKVVDDIQILLNNGKPDAGLVLSSKEQLVNKLTHTVTNDELTMVMLGMLPYVYQPDAETIANIGLGSGLTAHTILHDKNLKSLDTIEIEEAVYEAAQYFRPNVENIFTDGRSRIILEDAKTYFAASGNLYNVIVSEPPNPWVSGVSGLFSVEFYKEIKRYLHEDGVFVQWMHLYEISPFLVSTVYRALKENFSDIHLYQISEKDIAIVASNAQLQADYDKPFKEASLKAELSKINIKTPQDIAARKLAGNSKLDIIISALGESSNSDYFPILDHGASKTRFLDATAYQLYQLHQSKVVERLVNEVSPVFKNLTSAPYIPAIEAINQTEKFYDLFIQYRKSGVVPVAAKDVAGIYSKELAAILNSCNEDTSFETKEMLSDKMIEISYWASVYLSGDKQSKIFTQSKECDKSFNDIGYLWINVNLAWLNNNVTELFELTNHYLEKKSLLASGLDKQLIILNLASRMVLNIRDKDQIESFLNKMQTTMLSDLELRGLLYLLEPSLVKAL